MIPHGANAKELSLRVSLGESPMSAIVSATSLNAEIIGWSDRVGSIEKGKYADLISVPGDLVERHHAARACQLREERRRGVPR